MRHPLLLKEGRLFMTIALAIVQFLNAEYLDEPVALWSYQLPGSGTLAGPGLRRKNAVVATEEQLFVTTDVGDLYMLPLAEGAKEKRVKPPSVSGASTECHSGVSISYRNNGEVNFAVYAVQYSSTSLNSESKDDFVEKTSRVIAVNVDGTIRWTREFSGSVAGTPVTSKNVVYVSVSNKSEGGKVLILHDKESSLPTVAAEISPDRPPTRRAFGALTLKTSSTGKDYLFWGDSSFDGLPEDEHFIYTLYPSSEFEANQGIGVESYTLKRSGSWNRMPITEPVVANDLSAFWVGGSGSSVAGWVDNFQLMDSKDPADFDWQNRMTGPEMNLRQPIFTPMTLSSDDEFIFLTDNQVRLYCLRAKTGDTVWFSDGDGESGYMVQPRLNERTGEENSMVYTIETLRGNIRQHDVSNGDILWEFNCYDLSRTRLCQHSVEAEFSLSPDGNILYFGDIFGKITALRVASFGSPTISVTESPTDSPISTPTTLAPSFLPTSSPNTPVPVELSSTITLPISGTSNPVPENPATPTNVFSAPTFYPKTDVTPPTQRRPSSQPSKSEYQPTLLMDSASNGLSSTETLNSSTGSDNNSILLLALIIILIGCALVALAFFFLLLKRRRQEEKDAENLVILENKSTESITEDIQPEEFEKSNIATLVVINRGMNDLSTPKKRKNKKVVKTPATLESIEETPEDVSVASSVNDGDAQVNDNQGLNLAPSLLTLKTWSDPASNKNDLDPVETNDAGATSNYLPKALSSTFDQVIQNVLDGGVLTQHDDVPEKCSSLDSEAMSSVVRDQPSDFTEGEKEQPPLSTIPLHSSLDSAPHSPPPPPPSAHPLHFSLGSAPHSPPPPPPSSYGAAPETTFPPHDDDDANTIGSESLFLTDDEMAGNSISTRPLSPVLSQEGPSKELSKDNTNEGLKMKQNDPWNKFMSSIIDAEKEFFNPTLPTTQPRSPRHTTIPEIPQDSPFDENKI